MRQPPARWTRDRERGGYRAVGRHTEALLTRGSRGWNIEVCGNFGHKPFLDANGSDSLANAKVLAAEGMARWDREIELQGGPSRWR